MFGGKATASIKILSSARFRLPIWTLTVSPFSLWSINTGWIATGALAALIVTIKVVGLMLVQGEYTDPFTRYDAILPGQSVEALASYPCLITQPRVNGRLDADHFSCAIFPRDGFFDIIHVEGNNSIITEAIFYATNLKLGQLLLHWKPVVRPQVKTTVVGWITHNYSVDVYGWNVDGYSSEVYGKDLQYQKQVRIITVR